MKPVGKCCFGKRELLGEPPKGGVVEKRSSTAELRIEGRRREAKGVTNEVRLAAIHRVSTLSRLCQFANLPLELKRRVDGYL